MSSQYVTVERSTIYTESEFFHVVVDARRAIADGAMRQTVLPSSGKITLFNFKRLDDGRYQCDDDDDSIVSSYDEAVGLLAPLAAAEFGLEG